MGELRIKACVEAWPECASGQYNPACCRFPKSCSCTSYRDEIDPALLEGPVTEHHVGTLDLSGEGNRAEVASPISDEAVDLACLAMNDGVRSSHYRMRWEPEVHTILEAAYPAIREQVAEEIAVAIEGALMGLLSGLQARSAAAAIARAIGGLGGNPTAPGSAGGASGRTGLSASPSDPQAGKAGRSESGGFEG